MKIKVEGNGKGVLCYQAGNHLAFVESNLKQAKTHLAAGDRQAASKDLWQAWGRASEARDYVQDVETVSVIQKKAGDLAKDLAKKIPKDVQVRMKSLCDLTKKISSKALKACK